MYSHPRCIYSRMGHVSFLSLSMAEFYVFSLSTSHILSLVSTDLIEIFFFLFLQLSPATLPLRTHSSRLLISLVLPSPLLPLLLQTRLPRGASLERQLGRPLDLSSLKDLDAEECLTFFLRHLLSPAVYYLNAGEFYSMR